MELRGRDPNLGDKIVKLIDPKFVLDIVYSVKRESSDEIVIEFAYGVRKSLDDVTIEDVTKFYTETWEYAGWKDPLGQAVGTIINTLSNVINSVISGVRSVVDSVYSTVRNIWDTVKQIPSTLSNYFNTLKNAISGIVNQVVSQVSNVISGILTSISNTLNSVRAIIQSIPQLVYDKIRGIITSLESTFKGLITSLSNSIQNAFNTVRNVLNNVVQTLQNIRNQIVSSIQNTISSIRDAIVNTIQTISQNISNTLSGIVNRIIEGFKGVQTFLTGLAHNIQTQLGNIPKLFEGITNTLKGFIGQIAKYIEGIPKTISGILQDTLTKFRTWFSAIMDGITQIATTFRGFINPLVEIKNWLYTRISEVTKPITDAIQRFIGDPLGTLKEAFGKVIDFFTNIGEKAKELFAPIVNAIQSFIHDPLGTIAKAFEPVLDFFGNIKERAVELFKPITDALGKLDLSGITEFFGNIGKAISSVLSDPLKWISDRINDVVNFVRTKVIPVVQNVFKGFVSGITEFVNWISGVFKGIVGNAITTLKGAINTILIEPLMNATNVNKWMKDNETILKRCFFTSPANKAQQGFNMFLTAVLLGNLPFEVLAIYWFAKAVEDAGGLTKFIELKLSPILARLGVRIEPEKIKMGTTKLLKTVAKEWVKTMIFTTSFWIYEPFKYYVNPYVRWTTGLPHEIPTYHEIIKATRRYLPCTLMDDKTYQLAFQKVVEYTHTIMDYRAFPFWFEVMTLGEYTPEEVIQRAGFPKVFSFKITDRFGTTRTIPLVELYEIPPPTDTIRMMLRDVIQNLDDFEKIMAMHGFTKDITAMYYMLHFKYPSPSALFEFVSRVAGGVVWFSPTGKAKEIIESESENFTAWGLGFAPKTPIDLAKSVEKYRLPKPSQTPASIDTSKIDEVVTRRFNEIVGYIMPYFKWHDYFPMAWIDGFTSDQMIAIELSADIPQRIDARWMFKWGIISDTDLLRIVMARGMHPAWASKITIAEIMNAMSEERTVVRTGIINAFKEGFTTEENLHKQFRHLTDLEILGVKVPVVFLEGEAKLLTLRAKYDRALDILRDLVRQCVHGYQHNVYDFDTFKSKIKSVVETLAKSLDIPLAFDESYFNTYKEYLDVYHEIDTISRIRSWIRYSMYQLLYRFTRGYVPKDKAKELVSLFAETGKLTEEERKVFETLMDFMLDGYVNEVKVRAILRKLSRGVISLDEARKELESLKIPKDLVDALIEAYARVYTLSISTYLSYADYVPIDVKLLEKKLELLGVPEDEREIILEVFRIKPIRTEMSRAIERLLDLFEKGYITEEELKNRLSEHKLSRVGIEFLILASKIKKEEYSYKLYVDSILNKLKRGAITPDQAKEMLKNIVKDEEILNNLIEANMKIYTLSIATYLSYADYVDIDEELLKKKLEILGVPEDEQEIILQVFRIKPLRDEYAKQISETLKQFEEGYIDEDKLKSTLKELGKSDKEIQILVTFAKARKERRKAEYHVDAILNMVKRGAITLDKAKEELSKYIVDEDLINAILEKHVKTYTLSISTLLSYADEVYIPEELLMRKLEILGVPEDEREIVLQVFRIRPIKDERAKAIRTQIDMFVEGYIDEKTLRQELSKLGKLKEEIDLIVQYAKVEKNMEIYKLRIYTILNRLKRGALTVKEAKESLSRYIIDKDIVEALIEKAVKAYTLSVAQLLSYAEYVCIPEDVLKKKLEILGVPDDEIPIILQVFKIKPIHSEMSRAIERLLDLFEDGYITEDELKKELEKHKLSRVGIEFLILASKFKKQAYKDKLAVDAILHRYKHGMLDYESAKKELEKIIHDKDIVSLILAKNAPLHMWTVDKLISLYEYVPIDIRKITDRAKKLGYPEEDIKLMHAYTVAKEISSELQRYVNELGNDYVEGLLTEDEFKRALDEVATIKGKAKEKLGVDWIVFSPEEREILFWLYKMRKERYARRRERR